MDEVDRTLEALRVQIKKEIVDNYFAARVILEEEVTILDEEVRTYRERLKGLESLFAALYQALGDETVILKVMRLLSLEPWPGYGEFVKLPQAARMRLLEGRPCWGLTARSRQTRLVLCVYEELAKAAGELWIEYQKILGHLRLLNEDIDKFNSSFDFSLIAAQIEALEGGPPSMSGGLLAGEREELSTRMRFKRRKLTDEELPPPPRLPSYKEIKKRLADLLP